MTQSIPVTVGVGARHNYSHRMFDSVSNKRHAWLQRGVNVKWYGSCSCPIVNYTLTWSQSIKHLIIAEHMRNRLPSIALKKCKYTNVELDGIYVF